MNASLKAILPDGHDGEMPRVSGAYLLSITLDAPVSGTLRGTPYGLEAGEYLYAGSANGPGGIAARVARHMRRDKQPHWHVDALTVTASKVTALAFPGGSECELMQRLLESGLAQIAIKGFGSSDCRSCEAHLARLVSTAGGNPHAAG
ncbi:GIY-YIG nuclease family protein [Aurantiacibacter sp. MUD11]|uniref:GIY-YIG nuclease family protein n=1 Tax=Aurantiacibacter sp. MUD11 TaxID=3003265 RepID=UPI0022AB283D|nr:GIY-YIG nuclease family protein [Aurantiacibacter sp. MUD11]WAT19067.1 GIY-YIG nuclease family protein [Aurantiacibacter sp. MUD11]